MKRSKNFFKLVKKADCDVFWKGVHIKPLGGNRISVLDKKCSNTSDVQENFD